MILVGTNSLISIATNPTSIYCTKSETSQFCSNLLNRKRVQYSTIESSSSISNEVREIASCEYFDLHNELVPYVEAWSWQKSIVREKKVLIDKNEYCPDSVIALQHHPVYTLGTGGSQKYLNFDIENAPFDVYRTERGGEVTYHGPGQLVMYPIINLRNHKMDLHWYLRTLEEVIIRVLSSTFSIEASRVDGLTGVWVGDRKLAAIGIRVSKWIAYHGLALNVTTDLTPFQRIVPCGIRDREVGSIKQLLGEYHSSVTHPDDRQLMEVAHKSLIKEFSEIFQVELNHKPISLSEIPQSKTMELAHKLV